MSAPAGWHPQPDGRERFWDGSQWTDQFRTATPPADRDPTAPPPLPSWADGSTEGGSADPTAPASEPTSATPTWDRTQALDVTSTQAIPAQENPYPQQNPYGQPTPYGEQSPYGQPGPYGEQNQYGQPGPYGSQPTGWQPPPQRSGNAWLKGCLIALAVVLVLGIAGVVAAIVLVGRAVDTVSDGVSSSFPSGLPTGLPSDLPSGLPTEGLGEQIDIRVGRGFDVPRATIEDGWSLGKQGVGAVSIVTVNGMRATLNDDDGFPVLFTMSFNPAGGGDPVQTVCTAPAGSAGATVDVSCVPLLGDVADAREGTVTTTL